MTTQSEKVTTIGTFDGVHIGHQKIVQQVNNLAEKNGFESTVLTLFPHPRMVLFGDDSIKLLNTIDERVEILKSFGIKNVVVKEFTKEFANLSAQDYVKQILVDELNSKIIVIGYDHHFGKNRSANIHDLKRHAEGYGFSVEEISAQDIDHVTVSSTKIRKALEKGLVDTANAYLGYNFFITGVVVKGKEIGRTIDFPTANINIKESYKLIPGDGVYVVQSIIDGDVVYGMMNIGTNPTVNGKSRSLEVHFFDFNKDIYELKLRIAFLKRLRSEKKFQDLDALREQLQADMAEARALISELDE